MWSTKRAVDKGDLVIVWLVKSPELILPLNLMFDPDA